MLDSILKFVSEFAEGNRDTARFEDNDYRISAAALLVHAATIDGDISEDERERLYGLIKQRFQLDDTAAGQLIDAAEQAEQNAVDLYGFTSRLNRSMDEAERRRLVEMMWDIAFADGRISEFEDNLLWRAADLLHVSSRQRIELRRRVAEKYEIRSSSGSD